VFSKLLEQYGKTAEDIEFDYANMSDEELENAFKTAFDGEEPAEETPSDQDVADAVIELINALPVTVATTDEEQITAARTAYDALTDEQKALVSAEVLALLTGAEASLGEAKAAAANQTAATTVSDAINALTAANSVTLDDADAIIAARQAYDSLTAAQKALVESTVVDKLEAAEEALNVVRANQDDDAAPRKKKNNELTYTVEIDGEVKTFSVSLIDKLNALSNLVNNTYGDVDGTFYDVDAYDEDKYVIMHDYWRNKHYRQSYAVKKDIYSLKGDRVEVFAQYLTSDEIAKLDNIKSDYAIISEKVAKYDAEPFKMEILNSDEYSQVADTAEFAELKNVEKHFDMTVDEVRKAADDLLLAYAKNNKLDFTASGKKPVGMKKLDNQKGKKPGRYGNLFKK